MGVNFFCRNPRDSKFLLFEHLKIEKLQEYESFRDFNRKTITMIVDEALKLAKDVLGPTMQDGDREGCHFENGNVRFPESYYRAWQLFAETGWVALSNPPEYGGQGLPMVMAAIIGEFFQGANCTLAIGGELTAGAAGLIESFGTEAEKDIFLEKMYTGQWSGTMALTEPQAGSDVGGATTRAIPLADSATTRIYRIEGNKIFTTWGQQDITENIIHLVLARIDGAPEGTRGLSLFIVPKIWVQADGSLGTFNDVVCTGIEHKMGQSACPTCSLTFGGKGGCRGILLGSTTAGMNKMFQMMNELRLHTGLQGVALASAAYDAASQYAKTRIQGAPFTDLKGAAVPIVQHEDVRRMLMNLKAGTEALRALIGMVFYLADQARHDPSETVRKKVHRQLEFYIPIVKSCGSDFAYELIRDAIQIYGGYGYCKDYPVEQYSRDCKITSIVEGTNYIQAKDFVTRKIGVGKGDNQIFAEWFQEVRSFGEQHSTDSEFAIDSRVLIEAASATKHIADTLVTFFTNGTSHLVPLNATRLVECVADVTMAKLMLEQGLIARDTLKENKPLRADDIFYRGKIQTARYFCRSILPRVLARQRIVALADDSAIQISEEAL
jgi:alkylation response protein AidB-like acyl-CoA dehydrogenase